MKKVKIKLDDARDMVMKLDLDQANSLLGFLQSHRDLLQSMSDSDIQIGDIVVTVNGDTGTRSKSCGRVVDMDNKNVIFYPNRRRFDKRVSLKSIPARWVRKVS